jgi:hypothetical protein
MKKIERQLGLNLDQMAEIMSQLWEECDAAWLAIKTRVLCVFWAIGANVIRALADRTLDKEAACRRARQREEPHNLDEGLCRIAERDGAGRRLG